MLLNILDDVNAKSKVGEKRTSAQSHFNCFLTLRNHQLLSTDKPAGKSNYGELSFDDIDKGPYIGEYANYLASVARLYMNPNNELISYASATGYMGSIKNALLDKFHRVGIPSQLKAEVWKRKTTRVQSMKLDQAKNKNIPVFGTKESASDADRMGIITICIWSGSTANAEFLNFFKVL